MTVACLARVSSHRQARVAVPRAELTVAQSRDLDVVVAQLSVTNTAATSFFLAAAAAAALGAFHHHHVLFEIVIVVDITLQKTHIELVRVKHKIGKISHNKMLVLLPARSNYTNCP